MHNDYCSDILYLNKQRLLAMEELERVKNERSSLLDRIEQLEMKKEATSRKGSQLLEKILKYAVFELASTMLSLILVLQYRVASVDIFRVYCGVKWTMIINLLSNYLSQFDLLVDKHECMLQNVTLHCL